MSLGNPSGTPAAGVSLPEAIDFEQESLALSEHLNTLTDAELETPTAFKGWHLNDILAHLHFFNLMAHYTLVDEARFASEMKQLRGRMDAGQSMVQATNQMLNGLNGRALLATWQRNVSDMTARWVNADPRQRLQWVGPTMSVRSSISARLMETWAHGQAVYDLMGIVRKNTDRIRSIAVMGVNTFTWTFKNREEPAPATVPRVTLVAPSGAVWRFNESVPDDNAIAGSAEAFCQVVTQVRHVNDTDLAVSGDAAKAWMTKAQCFAGKPNDPPPPGTRFTAAQPWPAAR